MKVKDIALLERPREKAITYGIRQLSNRELLALFIRSGYHQHSALDIADELLNYYGSINLCLHVSIEELTRFKGIKVAKAVELVAVLELARRVLLEESREVDVVAAPISLVNWLQLSYGNMQQEHFIAVYLNVKNHIITHEVISKGGLDSASVHPREVFKLAVSCSAAKLIVIHNHPSQDTKPSLADIDVTKLLFEASRFLQIPLLDHIIVANNEYYSFKEHNMLNY
jgi:DNA repair protein RadC